MRTFYHGSPTPDIEILEPRLDPRLGVEGVFVSDEVFAPMVFALLPVRAHATVNLTTKGGKFIEGIVVTPKINEHGWLYTVEAEEDIVHERKSGRFMLTKPIKVVKVEKVEKADVLKMGWKIEIKSKL